MNLFKWAVAAACVSGYCIYQAGDAFNFWTFTGGWFSFSAFVQSVHAGRRWATLAAADRMRNKRLDINDALREDK